MNRGFTVWMLAATALLSWIACGTEETDALHSSTLSVNNMLTTCGDGNRAADEQCDDGDTENGDGCSSLCTVEPGYICTDANFSLAYTEGWSEINAPDPTWSLSADRLTVRQGTNSHPAVYMTNLPAVGASLVFDLAVETSDDDDFIGWVVGFDQGDRTNPQAEFMLFDWKQADQIVGGGLGRAGLAMSRVRGVAQPPGTDGWAGFWAHTGAVSEEARAIHLGRTGWADRVIYRVKMEYGTSRIRVWVNNVLEFDQQGSFPAGRFGFYTASQEQGRFTLVSPITGSICGPDPDAACTEVRLGGHNLFLLEDYNLGTDVEGKVAAGGNITMNNFSVGHRLPASDIAETLVAGGNLNLSNGGVWGDAWHGGNYTPSTTVTFVRGTASQGTPIDFAAQGAALRGLSAQLASLTPNGTATIETWGGLMLRGTDPDVNVFQVSASTLSNTVLLSIDAPASSLAVINISGGSATLRGGHQFIGGIDQQGVLFNFAEATSISASGYGLWGTMLAPYAHVAFHNGSFDGGIYAKSMTGNAEGHINPLRDHDICTGPSIRVLLARQPTTSAPGSQEELDLVKSYLNALGISYTAIDIGPEGLTSQQVQGYDAVVLLTYSYPVAHPATIATLVDFFQHGGGVIATGDDITWTAPGSTHQAAWEGLTRLESLSNGSFAVHPVQIPASGHPVVAGIEGTSFTYPLDIDEKRPKVSGAPAVLATARRGNTDVGPVIAAYEEPGTPRGRIVTINLAFYNGIDTTSPNGEPYIGPTIPAVTAQKLLSNSLRWVSRR
jgi:choice-of-anchor A domain-containing protein